MKFKTITNRIFTLVIPTVIITIVSFAVLSYHMSNSRINEMIDEKMHECLHASDLEIQLELYKNASVATNFAHYGKKLRIDTFNHEEHRNYLMEGIKTNENTFGGGVWFEPYAFDLSSYYFGPFLYIDHRNEIFYTYEYSDYVDYFNEDWYLKGKNSTGEIVWSKVYYDPFSNITMVTASKAFYNEDGKFIGMGTADMNLETIRRIVNDISVGETGKAFILGAEGEYISFYEEGKKGNGTIQQDADEALMQLGNELLETESGITTFLHNGKKLRVYYMTMANVNWTLAITIEESEIHSSTLNTFIVMTIIPIVGLTLVIFGIFSIVKYLRRIIHKVNNFADLAATGDFSKRINVTETDEFGYMEQRLNIMISNMNESVGKIREADERAKIMLDATPLCCSLIDKDCNIIDCNEEVVKLYRLKDKQVYMERFFELFPEYQPDGQLSITKMKTLVKEAFESGRVVFEWMHQNLNGTLMPSEVTLVRVKRGHEHIVAGYTRDLREYKKMMREIEYKDALLYTVNNAAAILLQSEIEEFENNLWKCMGMMVKSVDADRMYIWKNHMVNGELYCTQLYEWSEGVEPQQGKEITIDTPYSESAPGWKEKLSAGHSINGPVRDLSLEEQASLSPQGILSILVVPVFLREHFWGFVGFDDCHRERMFSIDEEAILRSGSLLIAHALLRNEMTLDIHAAVEAAQAASHAKSNFLSNMSHEIRTPLNAITGMTLIGKSASEAERKDYALGKIEDASNHLLGVINDILDMSKIEANKFELSNVEFNFEKMLQKVVNVINFRADIKGQDFMVFLDKNIPQMLIGDDQRLAQVITNLLSNAVKFTPEQGCIRLDTHLINEEEGICTIQIEVKDTGIGISKEQHSRLFISFEQAESNTSRQYGGTGLGLAISKHIVELMGGNIWVESELGKGSKFSFNIQIRRGSEEHLYSPYLASSWKNAQILVVDDEYEIRRYFASIAERLGIACDTAADGEEALRLIDTNAPYHIYFVDLKMPGMNGIELSREIKNRNADKSVIIMISAIDWYVIEKDAKLAGVDKYLQKPLFPSSISDCINEYLGQQSILTAMDKPEEIVSFQGYCILLAEDVAINREIVIALLEPTQLEIDCAVNGVEAVKMFSNAPERYDMIFMDIQMPEMDGLKATRNIRSLGFAKAKEIPIIAMTANVFREDIEQCKEAGMNDHVGKPLDFDDILGKMRQYLQPRS